MSFQNRGAVLAGEDIIIRAVFTDDAGCLQDLDAVPSIYIYDQSVPLATVRAEADAATYTSALVGPLSATNLSTGYYTYTYTVPAGSTAGTWHDLWVGTINTASDYEVFSFEVSTGFNASAQNLGQNQMVVIKLADTIANSDGDETLEAIDLFYTTTYNPLYASPDLVRLEMGRWIDYIPDDTLALMLHIASKEADFIQGRKTAAWSDIDFARQRFTVYDAVWRALMIPGQGQQAGYSSGKKKTLGDLSITDGSPVNTVPDELLEDIWKMRQEWWRVVNAGGAIVPGQGFAPNFAVKGLYDPDRRNVGRLWDSPEDYAYAQPSVNRKGRRTGRRRGSFGFYPTGNRTRPGWKQDRRYD